MLEWTPSKKKNAINFIHTGFIEKEKLDILNISEGQFQKSKSPSNYQQIDTFPNNTLRISKVSNQAQGLNRE